MKAFSTKARSWNIGYKIIAIIIMSVLVAAVTCACVVEETECTHTYDNACDAICNECEATRTVDPHVYDNACDEECNVCGATRTVGAHAYDNACDTDCNVCGATRTVGAHVYDNACDATCNECGEARTAEPHVYDNACDEECNVCGATRTVGAHVYDNACDTDCNECGETRTVEPHAYDNDCDGICNVCGATREVSHAHGTVLTAGDTTHYYLCSVCGDRKDETAHVFDQAVVGEEYLKAEATAATKAQYYMSCVCGKASDTEYFELDKAVATLSDIQDLTKIYDGLELADPTYTTNSDGAVTVEWYKDETKLDAKPVDAGTYTVRVMIAESATYVGVESEKEFTIEKKVLSGLEMEFTYCNYHAFSTEALTAADGIVSADLPLGIFVTVEFDGTAVGSSVEKAYLNISGGDVSVLDNYVLDMETLDAKIVAKAISDFSAEFTYCNYHAFSTEALTAADGIVSADLPLGIFVTVEFDGTAVGSSVEKAYLNISGGDVSVLDNYVLDMETLDVAIVPKTISGLSAEFTYCNYHAFSTEALTAADGILSADLPLGIFVTVEFDGTSVGSSVEKAYLNISGGDVSVLDNYVLDMDTLDVKIVPKTISGLYAEFVYDGRFAFSSERLTEAVGILAADLSYNIVVIVEFAGSDVDSAVSNAYLSVQGDDPSVLVNYALDLSTCSARIIPKVIEIPALTKDYDGSNVFSFVYNELGEDIEVQIVLEGAVNVGTYTDAAIVDMSIGSENYKIVATTASASITPREIWAEGVAFTYDGYDYFYDTDLSTAVVYQNLVDGEMIEGGDIKWVFESERAGAALLSVEFSDPEYYPNYEIDFSKCTASIEPKKLTLKEGESLSFVKDYDKLNQFTANIDTALLDGYVGTAAQMTVTVTAPSDHAGTYSSCVVLSPYVGHSTVIDSQNYDFSEITTATVRINRASLNIHVKVEYNGTVEFTLDNYRLTSENTGYDSYYQDYVLNGDVVYLDSFEVSSPKVTAETIAATWQLSGEDAENYAVDELSVEITPKKLTKLNIQITAATANSLVVTLLPKDGVIPGEVVKIKLPGLDKNQDFYNYTEIEMLIDEAAVRQGQEYVTLLEEGDYANYELATYDNNGVQMVGIISCVDECDVQYDGTCNCGTSHITETLTFAGGESVGASATITCDSMYEGGIYKVDLNGGRYSFEPSDNFATITVYDEAGKELASNSFIDGISLTAGTYYVHIGINSSPGSSDKITVHKLLDINNEFEVIVPEVIDENNPQQRTELIASYHSGGDRFVIFYEVGSMDVLDNTIGFYYTNDEGAYQTHAGDNIESINFYDVNGRLLAATWDAAKFEVVHADGVTAIGGVYIVITMNGEGENFYFGAE